MTMTMQEKASQISKIAMPSILANVALIITANGMTRRKAQPIARNIRLLNRARRKYVIHINTIDKIEIGAPILNTSDTFIKRLITKI